MIYRPITLFFVVLTFLITLKTHRTYVGQGDEPHYIVVSESILLDFDLDLSNNYDSPLLRSFDQRQYVDRPDGKKMPYHPIGLSILGVPAVAFSYAIASFSPEPNNPNDVRKKSWIRTKNIASFQMMVICAFTAILMFKLLVFLFGDIRKSWFISLVLILAPPLMPFGFLFFTEFPSAALIIWLFYRFAKGDPFNVMEGVLLGGLVWLHGRNYLLVAGFMLLRAIQYFNRPVIACDRTWINGLLTIFILVGGALLTNYYMWGGVSPALAYEGQGYQPFGLKYLPFSVPGLIFDGTYGLFVNSPIYLFFPAGFLFMWNKNKKLFLGIIILLIGGLIPISGFHEWWGGWCPSTRYLVPVVPLFSIAVAFFWFEIWKISWGKYLAISIAVTSLLISLIAWNDPRLLWNKYWVDTREFNHAYGVNEFWVGNFGKWGEKIQSLFPNFFLPYPIPQIYTAIFLIKLLAVNILIWAQLHRRSSSS